MGIKIIGICVIKNEDIYIERVLKNIVSFCDEIRVVDNCSTDSTVSIVKDFLKMHSNVSLEHLSDISLSHSIVQKYVGTDTWVFLVDGDEIYDPHGLSRLKPSILNGKYKNCWMVRGYFYHLIDLDMNSKKAVGYLAPPSKDPNKLYNLSLLKSWAVDREVPIGHCVTHVFKNSRYSSSKKPKKKKLYHNYSWDDCPLRCVHTRMLKRSSQEEHDTSINGRLNISNVLHNKSNNFRKKYRIGKKREKDVSDFFI